MAPRPMNSMSLSLGRPSRLSYIVSFAAMLVLGVFIHAQAWAAPQSSLQDILRGAYQSYPAIQSAKDQASASEQDLSAAKMQRFPVLSASAYQDQLGTSVQTLTLQQPVWLGGAISAGIDAAQARSEATEINLTGVENQVALEAITKFFEAQYLLERIEIQQESLQEHQKLVDLMTRRVQNEVSPITDLLLARARLEQVNLELTQFQTSLTNALSQLSSYAGFEVVAIKFSPSVRKGLDLPLAGYIERALLDYPQIRIAQKTAQELESQVTIERAKALPKVFLRHDQSFGGSAFTPSSNTFVSVEFQSGAGLSALYLVRATKSRQSATEAEVQVLKVRLRSDIEREWNLASSARRQAENLRRLALSTREVYESFSRQYAAGRKSWVDVLNAWREDQQIRALASEQDFLEVVSVARLNFFSSRLDLYK